MDYWRFARNPPLTKSSADRKGALLALSRGLPLGPLFARAQYAGVLLRYARSG